MKTVLLLTSLVLSFISCQAGPAVECQWGPSYWCQSEQTAAQCGQEAYCNSRVWKVQPDAQVQGVKSVQCDVCKIVVQFVDKEIDNNKTESEAQAAVEEICSSLGPLKDECDTVVDTYFPQIWQALTSKLDPDTVCSTIGLCTSDKLQKVAPKLPVKVKSVECDVCKMLVGYVDKFVEKNTSEAEAKAAVEKICDALGSLKDECEKLVNSSFDDIWQMLINQLDPGTVCTEIGLCSSSKLQKVAKLPVKVKSVQCDICKIVVKYLDKYVESNATEAEAEATLKDFCNVLGSLEDECNTLVNEFFPQIWQMLMNQVDPDTVCTEIKLCTSGAVAKVQSEAGGLECDACKMVAELMHKYVDENKTEGEVQRELEGFCKILGSLSSECDSLLENFFPEIWDMIVKDLDPSTICSELKLCSSQVAKIQVQAVSPVKSTECDFCKIIAMYLNKFIASNGTEAEAEDEVKKLCSLLGSEASKCNLVVDMFFDQIWKMVVDETEPDVICQLLKLCDNTTALKQPPVSGNVTCDFCQLVFVFIRPFVDDNDTEDDIREDLEDSLCNNFFMPDAQNKCVNFFETYFGYIWGKMRGEVDAGLICKDIGVCTNLPVQPTTPNQDFCKVCQVYAEYIRPQLNNNETEEVMKAAIRSGCYGLPTAYTNECVSFVEQWFDQMWKLAQGEFDNGRLCKQIGVCSSTVATVRQPTSYARRKIRLPKQTLCELCKLVVSYLKPFVDSNSTETEVEQALESLCSILPATYKDQCTKFVDDNFEEIWKALKEEVDSDMICKQIGVCNNTVAMVTKLPVSKLKHLSLPKQTACDVCKLVVNFLEKYVDTNATESEVKQALEQLCGILPSGFKDECNDLVDKNFGTIWLLVKSEFDNDLICKQIELCPNSSAVVALPQLPSLKPALTQQSACDMCKLVVTLIKPYVDNNSTESEVQEQLNELCNLLPGNYSKQCDSLLDDFFPSIWDMLKGEFDSDKICDQLKLCSSSSRTKSLQLLHRAGTGLVAPDDDIICYLCLVFDSFLIPYMKNETVEKIAVGDLQKLCVLLPSNITSQCLNYISTFIPEVWNLLKDDIVTGQFCAEVDACSPPSSMLAVLQELTIKSLSTKRLSAAASPACDVCKILAHFLRPFADNKTTEDEAVAAVEKLCSYLPTDYSQTCKNMTEKYFRQFWDDIQKELDSDKICEDADICQSKQLEVSGPLCVLCEFVMKELESMLDSNSTETEIKAALDKVCSFLPSSIKDDCDGFVNTYSEEIIKLLLDAVSPKVVCTVLHLCLGAETSSMAVMPVVESVEMDDCLLCKTVLEFVKTLVNDYQKPIEGALDDVCDFMPSTIKSECTAFVTEFGPAIVQMVDKEINPEQLCKDLKACKESSLMTPWMKLARAKSF